MASTQRRVALVTGSSRGLGAAIARRLARDGFAVAVNGRPGDEQVAAVGRGIRDEGGTAEGFCADVTDEQQVTGLVVAITGSLGPVDVLVLNATGPQPEAPVTEVAWADHVAQLDFFVKSPVLLGREVLPGCRPGGTVASSASTPRSPPPRADRPPGRGGPVRHHEHGGARFCPGGGTRTSPARSGRPISPRCPGRMGTPNDIAHAVSFLASEGAGFVTGQRIVVDGGRSLGA